MKHYKKLVKHYRDLSHKRYYQLREIQNKELTQQREQRDINNFLYTMESLIEQYNYLKKSLWVEAITYGTRLIRVLIQVPKVME